MNKAKDIFMYSLAALIMTLLFSSLYFILTQSIPAENKDLAYMALGLALGWGTMIISYFFGSSKGSADKNDLLKQPTSQEYTIFQTETGFQGRFIDGKLTPEFPTEKQVKEWVSKKKSVTGG